MNNLKCAVIAVIALCAFVLSAVSEEAQGQVTRMYRGSVKDHAKVPPRLKKRPPLHVPDGLLEVSREHLLKKVPPCDISPAKRIGIAPLPSPMPRPGYSRVSAEPLPSPSPRSKHERVGLDVGPVSLDTGPIGNEVGPIFSGDRVKLDTGPVNCPSLLDLLIDMHAEAVRQGDLGAADLLEELIVVWPEY